MNAPNASPLRGGAGTLRGDVVDVRTVGSMVRVRLSVPGWRAADPGQFAMVRAGGSACFLPRAFSVHSEGRLRAPGAPARVSFLVAPVGAATEELARLAPGDTVSVLGPLGRGFEAGGAFRSDGAAACAGSRLLVVGGGVGAAPFVLLLEWLAERAASHRRTVGEVLLLLGFRDEPQAAAVDLFEPALDDLRAAGVPARVDVICEDGSLGRAGLVTALLSDELRRDDLVVACGAHAMCEAVWDLVRAAGVAEAWFSLEAGMACGTGSCQGCVLPTSDGGLARVCREGPVFRGTEAFGPRAHPCSAKEAGRR